MVIAMTAHKTVAILCMIVGSISLLANEARGSLRGKRSTPVITEIFALDHLIEIVEKIEVKVTEMYLVTDYIRSLAYSDDYWTKVVGPPKAIPSGILTSGEVGILTKMVSLKNYGMTQQGVVRTSSGETIAIGNLMAGIMAGIYRNKRLTLSEWVTGATREIDNLYAATLARTLAETSLAKTNSASKDFFGPGGSWNSGGCPTRYSLSSSYVNKASEAQILGAVDGFIIGSGIQSWPRDTRLGQILRMYYGTEICFDKSFASCKRVNKLKELTTASALSGQIYAVSDALHLKNPTSYPNVNRGDIAQTANDVVQEFFPKIESVSKSQPCVTRQPGCELPANLVFLMDESGSISSIHFKTEKEFVSQIIDAFNISPRQTRVALIEFGSVAAIDFGLDLYGSKTRLRCAIDATQQRGGSTNTAGALDLARTQIFLPIQERQNDSSSTKQSSRNNIVILLTDGKSNQPNQTEIYAAINRIKEQVTDLTMIAVGVGNYNIKELKAFATDPKKHVITTNFDELLTLVKQLQNQTCTTPIKVPFKFNGNGILKEMQAFVSPGQRQLMTIPSSNFFGSSIFLDIIPRHGKISVYTSRTSDRPGPDNYDYKLDPIPNGQRAKVVIRDACQGAPNASMCNPLYVGIYHVETDNCACTEKSCFLPGQIIFTVARGDPPNPSRKTSVTVFSVAFVTAIGILHNTVFSTEHLIV